MNKLKQDNIWILQINQIKVTTTLAVQKIYKGKTRLMNEENISLDKKQTTIIHDDSDRV